MSNISNILKNNTGFYIEAGSNDGVTQSNTMWLEKRGWVGLLIEPNEIKYNECKRNRSSANIFEHCALVSNTYNCDTISGNFAEDDENSLMSQVNILLPDFDEHQKEAFLQKSNRNIVNVPAKTLQSIIDAYNIINIDFLSLDVEGYEYEAMNGLDFIKNPPKVIQIETSTYEQRINKMVEYLNQRGYIHIGLPDQNIINDQIFVLRNPVI